MRVQYRSAWEFRVLVRQDRTVGQTKKYILFDHDGVLVDTERWYYKAGERALAEIGVVLDHNQYLLDMCTGAGTWAQARAAGIDEHTVDGLREVRNVYYQEYLRTEPIEIDGVVEVLDELSNHVRMAIVTTAKREDFELIHQGRHITPYMDFVLVRNDYLRAKPDPEGSGPGSVDSLPAMTWSSLEGSAPCLLRIRRSSAAT